MKIFAYFLLACNLSLSAQQRPVLTKVDTLTQDEKTQLQAAQKAVDVAIQNFKNTQAMVAAIHGMTKQSWMEYSTWYEYNGDYILYYTEQFGYTNPEITGINGTAITPLSTGVTPQFGYIIGVTSVTSPSTNTLTTPILQSMSPK